jgi:hypothetical protein
VQPAFLRWDRKIVKYQGNYRRTREKTGRVWGFCKEVKIKKSNASDEESGGVDSGSIGRCAHPELS